MRFLQVHLSLSRGGANVACENIEDGLLRIGHQCRTLREPSPIAPLNPDHVLFHSFVSVTSDAYLGVMKEVEELGIPSSLLLHDYWPFCDQTNLVDRNRGWERCHAPCGGSCVPKKTGPIEELKKRALEMNLVCFSNSSAEIVRNFTGREVSVIEHGIDTNLFRPITPQKDPPTVMFCNAWGAKPIKGYKHWEWISARMANPALETTGDTRHTSMPAFFSEGDLMLFPSLWPETFGLVVIEALACGKPVIAYPAGIAGEILNGENGFVTETSNPAEMLGLIERYSSLSLPEREGMSLAARRTVESRFSLEMMAERYVEHARRIS